MNIREEREQEAAGEGGRSGEQATVSQTAQGVWTVWAAGNDQSHRQQGAGAGHGSRRQSDTQTAGGGVTEGSRRQSDTQTGGAGSLRRGCVSQTHREQGSHRKQGYNQRSREGAVRGASGGGGKELRSSISCTTGGASPNTIAIIQSD